MDKLSQGNLFFHRALDILGSMRSLNATLESGMHFCSKGLSNTVRCLKHMRLVQATLLVTQYVQGTQRSAQTWSIASSAIQGAVQIGLWRLPTAENLDIGPLEAEVRKRTWWMCYMVDKLGLCQNPDQL